MAHHYIITPGLLIRVSIDNMPHAGLLVINKCLVPSVYPVFLQVPPDQVCSFFSSVNEDIRRRCQYLDFKLVGHFLFYWDGTTTKKIKTT